MKEKILSEIRKKYKDKTLKIYMVGAGALANFVGIALSELDVGKVVIIDKDTIEETNLNRQILYFGGVGSNKADILRKRLRALNGNNDYFSLNMFVNKKSKYLFRWFRKPDIIIDCVDSFEVRSLLNKFATTYGIPLISGGTSPFAGQVITYVPGYSSCLNCEMGIDELAKKRKEEREREGGCTEVPEGSVVTTNQIIGSIMVGELKRILIGKDPLKGTIKYISSNPKRIGIIHSSKVCNCYNQGGFSKFKEGLFDNRYVNPIKRIFRVFTGEV